MTRRCANVDAPSVAAQSPCPSSTACGSTSTAALLAPAPARRWKTHRHNVGVQHHESQPPVALQWILQVESDDGLLLPILQPEVPGNPAVVLVHLAVPFAPVVKLAGCDVEPSDEPSGADLGLFRPAPDEIHDLVPRIVRNP